MRAVVYSTVAPAIVGLVEVARSLGIEPVAVITPRATGAAEAAERWNAILGETPEGLDVCFAADRSGLARLTRAYEPEIGLCAGYSWLIPPEVLEIPRLGILNGHPSLLPRHRGPFPFAWSVREGDAVIGMTVHLMDEGFDTGPILAQGSRPMPDDTTLEGLIPTLRELAGEVWPRALRRVLSGERGDPQTEEGATYAGPFGEEYAELDPRRTRAELLRQVRAWQLMWDSSVAGPLVTVDGRRVRVLEATAEQPDGGEPPRLEASDGPLWLTSVEAL